jgi:branched-chain amino acid transport system ATP-binding protein
VGDKRWGSDLPSRRECLGKSTTLKTILGVCRIKRGSVTLAGERIDGKPTKHIISKGVAIVPENRRIFPRLTVLENMEMGAYLRTDADRVKSDIEKMQAFAAQGAALTRRSSGRRGRCSHVERCSIRKSCSWTIIHGITPVLVDRQFGWLRVNKGTSIFVVDKNANMACPLPTGTITRRFHRADGRL